MRENISESRANSSELLANSSEQRAQQLLQLDVELCDQQVAGFGDLDTFCGHVCPLVFTRFLIAPVCAIVSVSLCLCVCRYYQNSFTDGDKQKAYDLFHGVFEVTADGPHLWEIDVEDSTSRRGGGVPPPFVPEGKSARIIPWYEDSIASFYDTSGGKDAQLERLMPANKGGSHEDSIRFENRHETSLITSFDEVLSR